MSRYMKEKDYLPVHLDGKMYTRLVEGELHHVSYDNEEEEE